MSSLTMPSSPDSRVTMAGRTMRLGSVIVRMGSGENRGEESGEVATTYLEASTSAPPMMSFWISVVPS